MYLFAQAKMVIHFKGVGGVKSYFTFFLHFYPTEFTPDGVLSSLLVRTYEIFFENCFFGILMLVVIDDSFIF